MYTTIARVNFISTKFYNLEHMGHSINFYNFNFHAYKMNHMLDICSQVLYKNNYNTNHENHEC